MKILIAGASGLIGTALGARLAREGHTVARLVRREPRTPDEIDWDPAARQLDSRRLEGVDAVINLSGENLAAGRWTEERRRRILQSRVDATATLVHAVSAMSRRPSVLLNASAVGFYGDRGEEELTEASSIGRGFLPEVCLAWETHAEGATRAGVRTVLMRFGVVLSAEGGALAKMLPVFRSGLAGRLGSGRQWMSWVALEDVVEAVLHALTEARCSGPMNFVAPNPVTNATFTETLARVLHRPAAVPVPAWTLRLALGEMADEALLASTRAVPDRLRETGYGFRQPELEGALRSVLR